MAGQYVYVRYFGGASPFVLYAVSNAGSLVAAFAYPLLLERRLDIVDQLHLVKAATAIVLGLMAAMIFIASRIARVTKHSVDRFASPHVERRHLLQWFTGGFVPVGLTMACTSFLSRDLGSEPMVWLGPFNAYLLTLILAFTDKGSRLLRILNPAAPAAAATLLVVLIRPLPSRPITYLVHLLCLIVLLGRWHLWLRDRRPETRGPMPFYAATLLGGTAASGLLGFLGPTLFGLGQYVDPNSHVGRTILAVGLPEYILFATASVVFIAAIDWVRPRSLRALARPVAEGLAIGLILPSAVAEVLGWSGSGLIAIAAACIVVAILVAVVNSPIQLLSAGTTVVALTLFKPLSSGMIVSDLRTAFGEIVVKDTNTNRLLMHGTTMHGRQSLRCITDSNAADCGADTYYASDGPIGVTWRLIKAKGQPVHYAVIGLGAGTLAAYCSDKDTARFFEIDPAVVDIATNAFSYLEAARRRCAQVDVVVGDARVSLRREPAGSFDLVVGDAFSSDAIPVHLLTLEAVREIARTLAPGGVIAFHTSNRFFALEPILLANAKSTGLFAIAVNDPGDNSTTGLRGRLSTRWVIAARLKQTITELQSLADAEGMSTDLTGALVPWTDQRHSLMEAVLPWSGRS